MQPILSKDLFQELKNSHDAVLILRRFQAYMQTEEAKKRQEFYDLVHENIKAEFINGEIVMHSPVRYKHWRVSAELVFELTAHSKKYNLGEVGVEKVMIELSRNNYEPDIVFFRKEVADKFVANQKLFPAPDLVVEILSESTRKNDYGVKFYDYAAHDVGEYWIIDPENGILEQYVLLENEFYLHNKVEKTGFITSLVVPGFVLDVAKIFI